VKTPQIAALDGMTPLGLAPTCKTCGRVRGTVAGACSSLIHLELERDSHGLPWPNK